MPQHTSASTTTAPDSDLIAAALRALADAIREASVAPRLARFDPDELRRQADLLEQSAAANEDAADLLALDGVQPAELADTDEREGEPEDDTPRGGGS
jgi:hypothetical protein